MSFPYVGLYTVMRMKKLFIFLKKTSYRLNSLYKKKTKMSLVVKNKSANKNIYNPVTNYDKLFEKFIRNLIQKTFPEDGIVGEEFKDRRAKNKFKWVIDPIDGTKAFIIGLPTWSNLIGLQHKKISIVGLANFPELNKFYLNDDKGSYVFKNKKKI